MTKIRKLRDEFDVLRTGPTDKTKQRGHMLLMGLHGLFTQLYGNRAAMLDHFENVCISWKHFEIMKKMAAMQVWLLMKQIEL